MVIKERREKRKKGRKGGRKDGGVGVWRNNQYEGEEKTKTMIKEEKYRTM